MNAAFLDRESLDRMGFRSLGENVLIHQSCVIVNPQSVSIGSNVRIDAFTVLSVSGGLSIGSYAHISTHVLAVGAGAFTMSDYSNLASGAKVFTSSDDFASGNLLGPTVPADARSVITAPVHFGQHVVVGAGSIIMPGSTIPDGTTIGALSLVKGMLREWTVYAGVPASPLKPRPRPA